jgi:hypothetical protein
MQARSGDEPASGVLLTQVGQICQEWGIGAPPDQVLRETYLEYLTGISDAFLAAVRRFLNGWIDRINERIGHENTRESDPGNQLDPVTHKRIANVLGVSEATVSRWRNGPQGSLEVADFIRMTWALGMQPSDAWPRLSMADLEWAGKERAVQDVLRRFAKAKTIPELTDERLRAIRNDALEATHPAHAAAHLVVEFALLHADCLNCVSDLMPAIDPSLPDLLPQGGSHD